MIYSYQIFSKISTRKGNTHCHSNTWFTFNQSEPRAARNDQWKVEIEKQWVTCSCPRHEQNLKPVRTFVFESCSCGSQGLRTGLCLWPCSGAIKDHRGGFLLLLYHSGRGLWPIQGSPLTLASTSTNTSMHRSETHTDAHKLRLVTEGWAGLCEEIRWSEKG